MLTVAKEIRMVQRAKLCSPHSPSNTETYPILRISNTSNNSFECAPSTPLNLGFRYSKTHTERPSCELRTLSWRKRQGGRPSQHKRTGVRAAQHREHCQTLPRQVWENVSEAAASKLGCGECLESRR